MVVNKINSLKTYNKVPLKKCACAGHAHHLFPMLQPERSAPRIKHPASSIQHPASSIQHPASSINHPASSIKYQASSIQHHRPYFLINASATFLGTKLFTLPPSFAISLIIDELMQEQSSRVIKNTVSISLFNLRFVSAI